jgi:hydrogenase maturation protease
VRTLLLGLGNELYGDDGVGIHIVRKIREEAQDQPVGSIPHDDICMEECSLSGLALLDIIIGYDRLILVDTIKRQSPSPGRIHLLEEGDIRAVPGPSPHYVSIPQMVEIGRRLGLHMPSTIKVVAVEAKNMYHLGEGLSPEMKEKLPAIIQEVKFLLTRN